MRPDGFERIDDRFERMQRQILRFYAVLQRTSPMAMSIVRLGFNIF